jgi:hypothetical protein
MAMFHRCTTFWVLKPCNEMGNGFAYEYSEANHLTFRQTTACSSTKCFFFFFFFFFFFAVRAETAIPLITSKDNPKRTTNLCVAAIAIRQECTCEK